MEMRFGKIEFSKNCERLQIIVTFHIARSNIPKPVWAVGFAIEQTLRDATLAVFSFADFKTASTYFYFLFFRICIVFLFVVSLLILFLLLQKYHQHN
ncbi:MAG: hypothetical protein LBH59_04695 [Planctomycetaceae bacterium]|nr:hypothetical protein [Planctomycetaceae bacterium]